VTVSGPAPRGLAGKWQGHPFLVTFGGGDNDILLDSTIESQPDKVSWQAEAPGVAQDFAVSSGILTRDTSCMTIAHNKIDNIFNAIALSGDQVGDHGRHYRIVDNSIDDFAGDGIDVVVSDALIEGNRITNAHDVCAHTCVHQDGIQGWTYNDRRDVVNENVVINANLIIEETRGDLPMRAGLQGITIFDGTWKNVTITNNIVVTDTWHGIWVGGIDGLLIANNTVLPNSEKQTWIQAGGSTKEGGFSRNVVVRNNIAAAIYPTKTRLPVENLSFDHNAVVHDPTRHFVLFDVRDGRYDLHLRPGSPLAGKGSADKAPARDFNGESRTPPINPGAYR
jgi:hypothetical protein